jgi:hypothetical protein
MRSFGMERDGDENRELARRKSLHNESLIPSMSMGGVSV